LGRSSNDNSVGLGQLFSDDVVAEIDALVTDIDARPCDQLLTVFCDLPQKLHLTRSPPSPNFATVSPSSGKKA